MKILVAEDNETLREVLCEHLVHCKHAAFQAADGEQAIAFLEGNHFDLLITDFRMPKVNGIEVIKEVKRVSPETTVWFMSGDDYTPGLADEARKAGATKCFGKPNLFFELRAAKII